jgi:hypothetical protein
MPMSGDAANPWLEAKRKLGSAYDEVLASYRDQGAAAPDWIMRVVKLPDGLECRVTIARRPLPRLPAAPPA